ncbi:hypothetical protein [Chromobacterium alticapitis]|uniref:Uncharacterized protein n=1 Tax=Chromobacterium alticapitis TaxID=2073169 RepID=A0A2S5DAT8_9NEIS|nr:hypothetical protein [Chromobacterium alticapitis]POZ60189.1 hypothetical protein C2I19_20130 [Chromobacterium alticapitis]
MSSRFWKNAAIATLLLLLLIGIAGLRMRSSLLAMDIGEMNKSPFWRVSTLVLLDDGERGAITRFTGDKNSNWHKFFTLASGMTVREVIENGEIALGTSSRP